VSGAGEFARRLSFLRDLEEHAVRRLRGEDVEAPDAMCAAVLETAREQIARLTRMDAPELPAELVSDDFLEGIYERAGRSAQHRLEPVLRDSLCRVAAPSAPLDALEVLGRPLELPERASESILKSIRENPIPAEHESVGGSTHGAGHPRRALRLAAAAVFVFGLVGSGIFSEALFTKRGTTAEDDLVITFMDAARPLDSSFSPSVIVRDLGS